MKYLIIIVLLVLGGCGNQGTDRGQLDKAVVQEGLIPLAVGNTWSYVDTKTGAKIKSSVDSYQYINGQYWFKYNELGDAFWIRNDGLNQYEAIDYFDKPKIDAGIINEALVLTVDINSYTFPGVNKATYERCKQRIKVPAGIFDCHVIKLDFGPGQYSINYYAENIGLVKNIYNSENGYLEVELTEYELK